MIFMALVAVNIQQICYSKPQPINPITGFTFAQAQILGGLGLAGASGAGKAAGALAAAATNALRGGRRGSRRGFFGRGRRQADDMNDIDVGRLLIENADQKIKVLQVLANLDEGMDCGKRYLCEIAAAEEQDRTIQDQLTLNLFEDYAEADLITAPFWKAVNAGLSATNPKECIKRYSKCPLPNIPISQMLKQIDQLTAVIN